MLAALVLRQQGIEVEWITFETPFFSADRARRAAEHTGIRLTVNNITDIYVQMLRNPSRGYGQNMNPCLDCHTLMFKLAGEMMRENNFDFMFSGEVLGQRPMSQTKPSLRYVEKHSGFDGYIVRPLCAKYLPETIPEQEGLVDRRQLLDISGRGRKRQIQLAKDFGLKEYPAPAGGCLLTDRGYSNRLRDLFAHRKHCTENELHLLKFGRHLRINAAAKAVIGRTEDENESILKYHNPLIDAVVKVKDYPGPTVLLTGDTTNAVVLLTASICVGYSKAPRLQAVEVSVRSPKSQAVVTVLGIAPKDIQHLLIK